MENLHTFVSDLKAFLSTNISRQVLPAEGLVNMSINRRCCQMYYIVHCYGNRQIESYARSLNMQF
jgi:hypothetical protein